MFPQSYQEIENLRNLPLEYEKMRGIFENLSEGVQPKIELTAVPLPVEYLKTNPEKWFRGDRVEKTFLSSGTASDARTKSMFSKAGLELYRRSALLGFVDFLKSNQIIIHSIVSLIPPPKSWAESSLSQMVDWFADFFPTKWIEMEEFSSACKNSSEGTIFIGTAFHWINLLDSKLGCPFPKHSFLMETGGTKGKSRNLSRLDFYEYLKDTLAIDDGQILSEYGMSEMSSQAWSRGDHQAKYKFPPWIRTFVTKGLGILENSGEGSLVVHDPTRVDFPYQLRLQDIASLNNSCFDLLGRVPHAALRGCSLGFEQEKTALPSNSSPQQFSNQKITWNEIKDCFRELVGDEGFQAQLNRELFSSEITTWALRDLMDSLPDCTKDFERAIKDSELFYDHILIIPPSTHAFAVFHPLILGLGQGANIRIRIPLEFSMKNSSLNQIIKHFQRWFPGYIGIIDRDRQLDSLPNEIMIFFGSHETLEKIKLNYTGNIAPYNSATAICIVKNLVHLPLAIKDCLSLAGKGCMSSRAIFVLDHDRTKILKTLSETETGLPKLILDIKNQCAIDHEEAWLIENNVPFKKRSDINEVLLTFPNINTFVFPRRLFIIPFLTLENQALEKLIQSLGNSLFISSDLPLTNLPVGVIQRKIGHLNISAMNGRHQDRPLFRPV